MWFAVWLTEYPDEGSMHFRAPDATTAFELARRTGSFAERDDGESGLPLLSVAPVTLAEHEAWVRFED